MNQSMEKAVMLLQQTDFAEKAADAEDMEAILALFRENGAALTGEELAEVLQHCLNEAAKHGELSEQDLELVAGGGHLPKLNDFKMALKSLFGVK